MKIDSQSSHERCGLWFSSAANILMVGNSPYITDLSIYTFLYLSIWAAKMICLNNFSWNRFFAVCEHKYMNVAPPPHTDTDRSFPANNNFGVKYAFIKPSGGSGQCDNISKFYSRSCSDWVGPPPPVLKIGIRFKATGVVQAHPTGSGNKIYQIWSYWIRLSCLVVL